MRFAMTVGRLHSRGYALLVLLLTAQNVCLASPRKWIELPSSHFVVVTNGTEHEARQVAEQFETIHGVFQNYFRTASISDRPLIIIAATDEHTFRPLLPEAWTRKGAARRSGLYLNGPDKSYIGLQIDQAYESLYHEYIHYLMRRMNARLPTWMVEGLAEFYANVRIESKKVLVGAPSASNLRILSERTPLPLTTLFEVNASSPYYNEDSKISIFYAESWALIHYLMARDWHDNTQRLSDFIDLLGPNISQVDAARKSIGDPAVLESALDLYVRKFAFTAVRLNKPQTAQSNYRVRTLSEPESLAVRADFMTHEGQYGKAQRMLEEALKLDPKLAIAYENMAFLYFQQHKEADAENWSKQAVALNPASYLGNYYYGASLLRDRLPNDSTVAAAEASLRTAISSNPDFAPAYDTLAFCLARPGSHQDLDEAHRMALTAVKKDPSDVGHRVEVVEVLLAMGRQEDAIKEATVAVSVAKTVADQSAAAGALEAAKRFQLPQKKTNEQPEVHASPVPSNQALGSLEVLTDTMGVDFNPYLDVLLRTVRQHWYALIPESASMKHGRVVLEFSVLKDGGVAGLRVVGTSGDVALDRPAYGSIMGSNPFPPLPPEFKGPNIGLRFSFYYNEEPRRSAITRFVADIKRKHGEKLSDDKDARTDLENDIASLTQFLEAGTLDTTDAAAAHYFRASAQILIDVLRKKDGLSLDKAINEQYLSDLDRILADKTDISAWGITRSEVAYTAGDLAWNGLHSPRTYSHWQLCIDTVPCMVNLASGYTLGWEGVPPDPGKALELDLKAFDTGTMYRCAGAFAAQNIAALIYFAGASYSKDEDPISWIQKSNDLSNRIEAQSNSADACGGAGARVDEFFYRLAKGDRRNNLLTQAVQRFGDRATTAPALAGYLSGSIDAAAFQSAVESSKSEFGRCYAYFYATWYAFILGDTPLINKFYEPLSRFDRSTCPYFLAFAKKFHSEGKQNQATSNPQSQ